MEEKLTILAVDDNSISLAKIEQELKKTYEIVPLNSGVRALQYLKQKTPYFTGYSDGSQRRH